MKMPPCPSCMQPHGLSFKQRVYDGAGEARTCKSCGARLLTRSWEWFALFFPSVLIIPRLISDDLPWLVMLPATIIAALLWIGVYFLLIAKLIPLRVKG